jgi:thiamine transport system permease protein
VDRHRAALSTSLRALRTALPLAFVALFFVFPLATLLARGLEADGRLAAPWQALDAGATADIVWFTLWQAALSTALTVLVGLPCAHALARYSFPGRSAVRAVVIVPFVLPTVVVGIAVLAVLPARLDHSLGAILLAHVFFNVAIVTRTVGSYWALVDPRIGDAAATLGAGPLRRFALVTLPSIAPAVVAAASVVFLFCSTSFGVILILGGSRYATLETEIYTQAARMFDLRAASALAVIQLAAVVALLVIAGRLERRLGRRQATGSPSAPGRPSGTRQWLEVVLPLGLLLGLLAVPLAALVERSLATPSGYGLDYYRALGSDGGAFLVPPWEAVVNSVVFALAATALALVIGGLAAVSIAGRGRRTAPARVLDLLLMLPLGTSAVMLGFGFVIAFDTPPYDFRSRIWLVPVAQALVAIPFVVRVVVPVLRAIDERLRDAAAVLGASPRQVWREVELPLLVRSLAVAAGFAFAIALGEFGATVFIARADHPTLPVAIYRFLGRPGALNTGQAMALSVVLMLVAAAAVLVTERVRLRRTGLA